MLVVSAIKRGIKDPTLAGTFIVTVGAFLGSIFSYILQIGLGHLLSIEDFGTFNAFLSLSVIFGIPAGAVSVSLIKKVSELLAKSDFFTLRKLFWSFTKLSLAFGLILSGIFVALNNKVAGYLNIPHNQVVLVFAFFLLLSFLNVSTLAYLQGLLRFKAYALLSVISQFLRLVIPLFLVYIGLSVSGAYTGLSLVVILTFILAVMLLNKNLRMGLKPGNPAFTAETKSIYKDLLMFSIPAFFINSGVSVLNNIDIVMVKHFFNPYEAGIYSGVVTMCKVFLFGASIVQVVMFPQISHLYASGGNYKGVIIKFLGMQMALILGGLLLFGFFPSLINSLMFGGKFGASVVYLPLFAVFTSLYILITFFSMLLLAINKTRAYLVILPACTIQYLLINLLHNSVFSIIKINILAGGLACLFIAIYVAKSLSGGKIRV